MLTELAIYVGLGILWALPFRFVFRGVARADPKRRARTERRMTMRRWMLAAAAAGGGAGSAAEEVGEVTTAIRILGANHRIVIEAFDDPKVEGVSCFSAGRAPAASRGASASPRTPPTPRSSCQQTGPVKFREELEDGEQVFSVRASLIFKHVQVVRFHDEARNALIYLTYSDRVIEGSPKNSISAVAIRDWQPPEPAPSTAPRRPGNAGRRRAGGARASSRPRWRWRPRRWRRTAAGTMPLPAGRAFRAVIGDMDSLRGSGRLRAAGVAIFEVGEQDTTDLEKCLYSVEAPLYIGLGFLGGRIDHHLAAMNALVKYPGKPVVLIGARTSASSARPPSRSTSRRARGCRSSPWGR